jgi:hypothetical protein
MQSSATSDSCLKACSDCLCSGSCCDLCISVSVDSFTSRSPSNANNRSPGLEWLRAEVLQGDSWRCIAVWSQSTPASHYNGRSNTRSVLVSNPVWVSWQGLSLMYWTALSYGVDIRNHWTSSLYTANSSHYEDHQQACSISVDASLLTQCIIQLSHLPFSAAEPHKKWLQSRINTGCSTRRCSIWAP